MAFNNAPLAQTNFVNYGGLRPPTAGCFARCFFEESFLKGAGRTAGHT
jgi:hypothetical protein